MILSAACFCIREAASCVLTLSHDDLKDLFSYMDEDDIKNIANKIDDVKKYLMVAGIICAIVGAIILFVILVTNFHMGSKLFENV